jgi:hypothetical protein
MFHSSSGLGFSIRQVISHSLIKGAGVVLLLVLLVNVPLIIKVFGFYARPLMVDADATALAGKYSGWKLSNVTGLVVAASATTRVSGGYVYDPNTGTTQGRIRTDVTDSIRLRFANGQQDDVRLLNFNVNPNPGDVVTVCHANKGDKWVTVAVLNHTVNRQFVNDEDLFKLLEPHGVLWLILSIVFTSFAVMFGAFIFVILWIPLIVFYLRGQKHARQKFASSGIAPLWLQSKDQAQRLLPQ